MSAPQTSTDRITTHVLDQTTGKPGEGIRARLGLFSPLMSEEPRLLRSQYFYADTAPGSGRVTRWYHLHKDPVDAAQIPVGELEKHDDGLRVQDVLDDLLRLDAPQSTWVLRLDTLDYWKERRISTFYPFMEVHFSVDQKEGRDHWHVPFLLGPHGFTTYRGT
jgi:5-hydroxyisourate hydrolase-like protein (transthyretin family)